MFDQNDQNQNLQNTSVTPEPVMPSTDPLSMNTTVASDSTQPAMADSSTGTAPLTDSSMPTTDFNTTVLSSIPDTTSSSVDSTPVDTSMTTPEPVSETPTVTDQTAKNSDGAHDDLLAIKQDALHSLSPLISQLEQSPEEKFRTTMMLIQASDDQSLIEAAYSAAKEITDEKVRAQALLDIVNEINYFTQNKTA